MRAQPYCNMTRYELEACRSTQNLLSQTRGHNSSPVQYLAVSGNVTKVVTTMLGFVHMYTIKRSCPPVGQKPSHQHIFGHNFDDGVAIKISLGGLKNTGFVCIHIYTYISTCLFINVLIFKIAHSGLGLANSWS